MSVTRFSTHLTGYPRIGANRELKWALEHQWAGKTARPEFDRRIDELRREHLAEQRRLTGGATDDFFLYDMTLETAMMLGLIPAWARSDDPFGALTSLSRGRADHEAWEMTKWFDTNYHYVVPEITELPERFSALPWRAPLDDATWVVLGPYSLTKLSKLAVDPAEFAAAAGLALWDWVRAKAEEHPGFRLQVDEPTLGLVLDDGDRALLEAAYGPAGDLGLASPPLLSVQFGTPDPETVTRLGSAGFAVQIPVLDLPALIGSNALSTQPALLISVADGRSVWPDDLTEVVDVLTALDDRRSVFLTATTSLMFLPYTVDGENLPSGFQFAREKAAAIAGLVDALGSDDGVGAPELTVPVFPALEDPAPRSHRDERKAAQADLDLPLFPTTTTGSLPQTPEVRKLRNDLRKGVIDEAAYEAAVDERIRRAIDWQEKLGLDVLVHGEFERSDMVEYFAEKMDGFYTSTNGWVLSYGSRCVRPPILAGPPSISEPMTVREWKVAQEAADRPVKGMLTGPVTIVNWSFRPPGVPDDLLFWAVAAPIADEVGFLTDAGARVIQIDEPAVRERWPLATPDAAELRDVYARGVRASLQRVFQAPPEVQLHTHMCYGDFGDIVPLWEPVGVDVASIEFSRSKDDSYIRSFYDLFPDGHLQIGPGVFDVHSPHTPGAEVMEDRLSYFLDFMDGTDVWVNPDCGLKTRSWDDIEAQLTDLVAAAEHARAKAAG
jgi:5-methyltetrahydropteroyltriglutamate--homocysteine methyltransferase